MEIKTIVFIHSLPLITHNNKKPTAHYKSTVGFVFLNAFRKERYIF